MEMSITKRIFALELDNDIKGLAERKQYIEGLIARLPEPDIVLLPELALCSYMASSEIWRYADNCGAATLEWGRQLAQRYSIYIGIGYLDKEAGDYYNRYMLVGEEGLCGTVTKSEGESAVFKRGHFGNIIQTPFGNVAVAICYDAKRKHFYENIRDEALSLIVFPHGSPADPKKPEEEAGINDYMCETYAETFGVPVVYVNSTGELPYMPGRMGRMMQKAGFRMNGRSKLYSKGGRPIESPVAEAHGMEVTLSPQRRGKDIRFYGQDLIKGNRLFRKLILEPDTRRGIAAYERSKASPSE